MNIYSNDAPLLSQGATIGRRDCVHCCFVCFVYFLVDEYCIREKVVL